MRLKYDVVWAKPNYGECELDGLWSVKWMRWKWITKWKSCTLVYEMNEKKMTRQICNTIKFENAFREKEKLRPAAESSFKG